MPLHLLALAGCVLLLRPCSGGHNSCSRSRGECYSGNASHASSLGVGFMQLRTVPGRRPVDSNDDTMFPRAAAKTQHETIGQPGQQLHAPGLLERPRIPKLGHFRPPQDPRSAPVSNDTSICSKNIFARAELCPAACPYAAEVESSFCHFRCVRKEQCGLLGTVPSATIPDADLHACRRCEVEGCMTCKAGLPGKLDEKLERCKACLPGYSLTYEGECSMRGQWVFAMMLAITGVAVMILLAWYLRVLARPVVNPSGVSCGLDGRARARVSKRSSEGDRDIPYPLSTNLTRTNVAGVGTLLFFRFQAALLVWVVTLVATWLFLAFAVSTDLLILGNRSAVTPQLLCAVISWGRNRQLALLWVKVAWLSSAYLFSFVGAITYAIQQTRLIKECDSENTTMADFAAVLEGLPPMKGSQLVEAMVAEKVEEATGQSVEGVSVAWNYTAKAHMIEDELEKDMCLQRLNATGLTEIPSPPPGFDTPITKKILKAWHVHLDDDHGYGSSDAEIRQTVLGLETAPIAFVIFKTECGRDLALERTNLQICGHDCILKQAKYEPLEVLWKNLTINKKQRRANQVKGTLIVLAACLLWTVLLYLPYAYYMASFSYANGDEPGPVSEGVFISLVVGSQIGIFVASSVASRHCGFHHESEVQEMYTLFYNSALILNLVMDIFLQAYLSYLQMVGVGAHTASGRLLGEMNSFQKVFESYPMQKSLGRLLFKYCWPCTFFVPFVAEPFVAHVLPQHIGKLLVGRYPQIRGQQAVKALELSEMEQGRYADIIFNVILVTCISFVAPAYIHQTFLALLASHLYLYCYDHVKVLRCVVKFDFTSPDVHYLGMQLFAIPVAILAGALVFKANQLSGGEDLGSGVLQGYWLLMGICLAMLTHAGLHLLALRCVVQSVDTKVDRSHSMATYADYGKKFPATFFSVNPVHCLRCKYGISQRTEQDFYSPLKG